MIIRYAINPFKDILPSKEPFSLPPVIQLGNEKYLVCLLWDMEILHTKLSDDAYSELYHEGVTAQAKLRGEDGVEHYAKILDRIFCVHLTYTGFRSSPPPKSAFIFAEEQPTETEEDDMRPIDKLKEFIVANYYEDSDQEAVREGLAACDDYKAVWAYINWDANLWDEMLEAFFAI